MDKKKITLYTDGACSGNPGAGGYGIILMYGNNKKELSEGFARTTNNRMELLAVIKGLEALKESCKVEVYSDSKYVVDAIEKGWVYNWKAKKWMHTPSKPTPNADLWKRLLKLMQQHEVSFHWVKGHASDPNNNRCDTLAREAICGKHLSKDTGYIQ